MTKMLLFLILSFPAFSQAQVALKPTEFLTRFQKATDPILVDVRTPGEFARGYIEGATLIDINSSEFESKILRLPKNQPIFLYCLSGSRSASAARFLKSKGYISVHDLQNGIMSWSRAGLPLTKSSSGAPKADWNAERFKKAIASPKPTIIAFYAPWCSPCKKMEPGFLTLSKEFATHLDFHKIDLDKNAGLADQEKVAALPVTRLYAKGKLVVEKQGFLSDAELRNLFEQAKKL